MPLQPIRAFFPLEDDVMGGVGPSVQLAGLPPAPPAGPEAILFTGNWQNGRGHIYKVLTDGTGLTQLTTAPANTTDIAAWSPDATRFAVVRQAFALHGGASLLVANADGSSLTTIWTGSGSAFPASQPSWTPDGSQVVVAYEAISASGNGSGAAFVNADGSGHTLVPISVPSIAGGLGGVIDTNFLDSGMYVSPDGTKLAFSIDYVATPNPVNFSFYPATCGLAGGTATVLTAPVVANSSNAWAQSWFSDSTRLLCYGNGLPGGARLFSMVTGTGALIDLVTGLFGIPEFQPSLSPDDTRIANTDSAHGLTINPVGPGLTTTAVPVSPLSPAVPSWGRSAGSPPTVGEVIAQTAMGGIRRRGKVMGGVSAASVQIGL